MTANEEHNTLLKSLKNFSNERGNGNSNSKDDDRVLQTLGDSNGATHDMIHGSGSNRCDGQPKHTYETLLGNSKNSSKINIFQNHSNAPNLDGGNTPITKIGPNTPQQHHPDGLDPPIDISNAGAGVACAYGNDDADFDHNNGGNDKLMENRKIHNPNKNQDEIETLKDTIKHHSNCDKNNSYIFSSVAGTLYKKSQYDHKDAVLTETDK